MTNRTLTARSAALDALHRWRSGLERSEADPKAFLHADTLFHETAGQFAQRSDRGLFAELFYGAIRNLALLDHWIEQLAKGHLDNLTHDILSIGLYQTLIVRMADHAAVNETVELAGRAKGLVNAVLRRSIRERDALVSAAEKLDIATRFSHPEFLVERWKAAFGEERTQRLCEWNNQPAQVFGRVNTLRTTREKLVAESQGLEPSDLHPLSVEVTGPFDELLSKGLIYIQDPSTLGPADLLAPQAGERVLDACAAPGGKTTYMAAMMEDRGEIVAVDLHADRLGALRDNLGRAGLRSVRVMEHDWLSSAPSDNLGTFDRVLLDAPCTNTGVLRRRVDARWRLDAGDFDRMPELQLRMLNAISTLVNPGGRLVYSTCSIDKSENDNVVDSFCRASAFRHVGTWSSFSPESGMDGAFAALLERTGD
jgi:16S rRNA (cytosine967-C5)-methyltransferase